LYIYLVPDRDALRAVRRYGKVVSATELSSSDVRLWKLSGLCLASDIAEVFKALTGTGPADVPCLGTLSKAGSKLVFSKQIPDNLGEAKALVTKLQPLGIALAQFLPEQTRQELDFDLPGSELTDMPPQLPPVTLEVGVDVGASNNGSSGDAASTVEEGEVREDD
jgi:hypothetical protein